MKLCLCHNAPFAIGCYPKKVIFRQYVEYGHRFGDLRTPMLKKRTPECWLMIMMENGSPDIGHVLDKSLSRCFAGSFRFRLSGFECNFGDGKDKRRFMMNHSDKDQSLDVIPCSTLGLHGWAGGCSRLPIDFHHLRSAGLSINQSEYLGNTLQTKNHHMALPLLLSRQILE